MCRINDSDTVGKVKLGRSDLEEEVRLDFPIADGPFAPTWESIESNYPGTPDWLRECKFGIWVHVGPQSMGESGDWYARNLYKQGSAAYLSHLKNYGHPSQVGYKEVLRDWNPAKLDPMEMAKIYRDAGARFLIVQGVHHDNFDLWDSKHQPWNSVQLGPRRDLLGEWAEAAKAVGLRFGVSFHHEYTWWWWQSAFGSDHSGSLAGVPYDGHLNLSDGVGQWWQGLDPRLLYTVNLREYQGVAKAAETDWSPPPAGIFAGHADYSRWYATWWAQRILDVIDRYDPDFIYTDGTGDQPFSGADTGTGYKCDALQRVLAHYYNRSLERRSKVDVFSVIKFRRKTNGTVTTKEFGIPEHILNDEPWIAEVPVGDWYYRPGIVNDSGMVIRYLVEAAARDGNAAVCVSPQPDGSLDEESCRMLEEIGGWLNINGSGIYGSRSWKCAGEGEIVDGKLKMLPGGKLDWEHADFPFEENDFRFTQGSDGSIYAFCMVVPKSGAHLRIRSMGSSARLFEAGVRRVELLDEPGLQLEWRQEKDALTIFCPDRFKSKTAVAFRVYS